MGFAWLLDYTKGLLKTKNEKKRKKVCIVIELSQGRYHRLMLDRQVFWGEGLEEGKIESLRFSKGASGCAVGYHF